MNHGFLALPRWLVDEFEGNGELLGFYLMLCAKAWYADSKKPLKEGGFLLRGQLLDTERNLAEWHCPRQAERGRAQVRRFLRALVKRNRIELKKSGPENGPKKSPEKSRRATIIIIKDYEQLFCKDEGERNEKEPKERPKKSPRRAQEEPTDNKGTREQGDNDFIARGRAGADKPRGKIENQGLALKEEAHAIGQLLFIPPNEGKRQAETRFVSIKALNAAMEHALADVGIEALRTWRHEATAAGNLGHYLFNANTVINIARRFVAPKENP